MPLIIGNVSGRRPGQDLGHTRARADERLELFSGPPELLAARGDGVNGRELLDRKRPTFVGVDQRCERIELAFLARAGFRIPKLLDATKRLLMRAGINDGFNHVPSNLVRVDAIVLCMSPDETDEY